MSIRPSAMSLTTESVSPKAVPKAPLPTDDPLSEAQWRTFLAIVDTILPAVKPDTTANPQREIAVKDKDYSTAISTLRGLSTESSSDALVASYLSESGSSNLVLRENLHRTLMLYIRPSMRKDLIFVLNLLG